MAAAIFSEEQMMEAVREFIGHNAFLIAQWQKVSEQEIERRLGNPATKLDELEIRAIQLHIFVAYLTIRLGINLPFTNITSQMSLKDLANYLNANRGLNPFLKPEIIGPAVF